MEITRKLRRLVLAAAAVAVMTPSSTLAQGPPSTDGAGAGTPRPGVRWSLGLGVISSPRPYVGASNSTRVVPLLELYYKRLFVQGIRAGVRIVQQGPLTLDAVTGPRFLGFSEDESDFLGGMEERRESIDVGLSLGWNRPSWGVRAFARHDISGHSEGTQAGVDVYLLRAFARGRLRLQPAIGVEWLDHATVDYYYGVRTEEQRPHRPAYDGESTVNVSGSVLLLYGLTPRINLTSIVRVSAFGDGISNSPIVDRNGSYFGLLGLSHRF